MNRRAFLKRFGIGVTAALVLASLPEAAIRSLTTEQAAKRLACEYLRKVYNEYCRQHPGAYPVRMEVGRELFDAYEGELQANERFVRRTVGEFDVIDTSPGLMFKGAEVRPVGRGWLATVTREAHVS